MNLAGLEERCWDFMGKPDSGQRRDHERQTIRDALNNAVQEIAQALPQALSLTREASLTVTAGAATYSLNDWALRLVQVFRKNDVGGVLRQYWPAQADRESLRSTALGASTPYDYIVSPLTSSAYKSGGAGTVAEAATAFTEGTATPFAAADVGRMLRLGGEDADYEIAAYVSTSALTLARAARARLSGTGTTGTGAGYSAVRWELGPKGGLQIQLMPSPSTGETLYYTYVRRPPWMLYADETPEVQGDFHHLIWKRALGTVMLGKEAMQRYQALGQEVAQAMQSWKESDQNTTMGAEQARPRFSSLQSLARRDTDGGRRWRR